jgi:hypothetical protein
MRREEKEIIDIGSSVPPGAVRHPALPDPQGNAVRKFLGRHRADVVDIVDVVPKDQRQLLRTIEPISNRQIAAFLLLQNR